MNKIVVGLTGGICGGKTAVSNIFASLGCAVVDADVISKKVSAVGGAAERAIADSFPEALFEGVIDRRKLKEIVFNDSAELKKLNSVTHPVIAAQMKAEIESSDKEIVIAVVPLLFETGMQNLADVTVTVSCGENVRIERLIKRDNIGRELAEKIILSQFTDDERERLADIVIRNEGNEAELKRETERVFEKIKRGEYK